MPLVRLIQPLLSSKRWKKSIASFFYSQSPVFYMLFLLLEPKWSNQRFQKSIHRSSSKQRVVKKISRKCTRRLLDLGLKRGAENQRIPRKISGRPFDRQKNISLKRRRTAASCSCSFIFERTKDHLCRWANSLSWSKEQRNRPSSITRTECKRSYGPCGHPWSNIGSRIRSCVGHEWMEEINPINLIYVFILLVLSDSLPVIGLFFSIVLLKSHQPKIHPRWIKWCVFISLLFQVLLTVFLLLSIHVSEVQLGPAVQEVI